ncbi:MAG TPA: hypothetical protein EYG68_03985 [Leucothrix mucor]|nr:hypothetical protein [Leucothrix mucor]
MLSKIRYYFEIVSLPLFIILALHLASNGVLKMMGGEHHHGHDDSFSSPMGSLLDHGHESISLDTIFSVENIIAVVLLIFFVWIWHTSLLKKWVPCSHTLCHKEQKSAHIIATIALCAHFFPEAELRQALLLKQNINLISSISSFAFISHFIVDVMVAIFLSLFWQKRWQVWLSITAISSVWIATTIFANSHEGVYFSHAFILLLSSFLLAMFIHKPHSGNLKVKQKSARCVS